ncbi:DNA repair exonuclease [Bosea sp. 117]|uniref:metallophosphoesterase family protein n=1 Tax=Bosea sp. 117 TaxID=1125973 RepID=UPI000493D815|nr:DNA repair exonuclease [Bosea sp. 117]
MFRFVHSSDLHIGKRFGNMPEELRGRLREARHMALERLAREARATGAGTILLAGDSFDTETPSPAMLRQALSAMAGAPLRWIVLPGNHDSLLADDLWAAAQGALPDNVHLALTPEPLLFDGAAILSAPCTTRRPGRDLTEWMDDAATADGVIRIGLAHGPVQSFSEDGVGADVIAPNRPARAGLDYLALGDWHGQMRIGERCWYSGAPEPDRFKHDQPGRALLVSIAAPGAPADVAPIETGSFDWRTVPLDLLSGDDAVAALARALPAAAMRRHALLRISASGRTSPAMRSALEQAVAREAPEFGLLELDMDGLATDCEAGDLDAIDRAGALRQAAEALLAESNDEARSSAEREVASSALLRLFSYCEALRA